MWNMRRHALNPHSMQWHGVQSAPQSLQVMMAQYTQHHTPSHTSPTPHIHRYDAPLNAMARCLPQCTLWPLTHRP